MLEGEEDRDVIFDDGGDDPDLDALSTTHNLHPGISSSLKSNLNPRDITTIGLQDLRARLTIIPQANFMNLVMLGNIAMIVMSINFPCL